MANDTVVEPDRDELAEIDHQVIRLFAMVSDGQALNHPWLHTEDERHRSPSPSRWGWWRAPTNASATTR